MLDALVFDPGETTGVVLVRISPEQLELREVRQVTYDNRFSLHHMVQQHQPLLVIVEEFRLYQHKAASQVNSDFKTVRVIGILELAVRLCWEANQRPYRWVEQPASIQSRVEVLPEHESQLKGYRHATSAYKHARYFQVMNRRRIAQFLAISNGSPL